MYRLILLCNIYKFFHEIIYLIFSANIAFPIKTYIYSCSENKHLLENKKKVKIKTQNI